MSDSHISSVVDHAGHAGQALNLLIETAHDLSRTLSLRELMGKIVTRARQLVGANIAWVTTLDEEAQLFSNIATEGHLSPGVAQMIARPDQGVVSVVMQTKTFFATRDYLGDDRFNHSPDLDAQFRAERIVSLAGFPIMADGKVQGLLFVADRFARDYTGREISILGSFALHAGIAIRNAATFARLNDALADAETSRAALEAHIQRVERSSEVHDEMMAMLAQGAGLTSFLTRMAAVVGGAIQLRDPSLSLKHEIRAPGYEGALLDRLRRVDPSRIVAALSRSRANGKVAVLAEEGGERCLALALPGRASQSDGLLICLNEPADDIQIRNLERCSVALSIAELWSDERESGRDLPDPTLLRHLALVPQPDPFIVEVARKRLKLGLSEAVQLAVLGADSGLPKSVPPHPVLRDVIADRCVLLGPAVALRDALTVMQGAVGILSRPFERLEDAAHHFARIASIQATMRRLGRLTWVMPEDQVSLIARLFETADRNHINTFVQSRLGAIEKRDPNGRAQLKATLLSYFNNQFSLNSTASSLDIHVNTVRQRLATLTQVLGGWDDPVKRLDVHVALQLDALCAKGGEH